MLNVDDEVRTAYLRTLRKAKIDILTSANVTKFTDDFVHYTFQDQEHAINADKVLLAVGMKANTSGLEHLGLEIKMEL